LDVHGRILSDAGQNHSLSLWETAGVRVPWRWFLTSLNPQGFASG